MSVGDMVAADEVQRIGFQAAQDVVMDFADKLAKKTMVKCWLHRDGRPVMDPHPAYRLGIDGKECHQEVSTNETDADHPTSSDE